MARHSNKLWLPWRSGSSETTYAAGAASTITLTNEMETTLGADVGAYTLLRTVMTVGVSGQGAATSDMMHLVIAGIVIPESLAAPDVELVYVALVTRNHIYEFDVKTSRVVRAVQDEAIIRVFNKGDQSLKALVAGRTLIIRK